MVALTVLSIIAVFFFVRESSPKLSLGLEKGKTFAQLSNIDYSKSDQTLLIALNSTCSYCQESLPLYRRVTSNRVRTDKALRVVGLFPNDAEEVVKYIQQNQLIIDTVAGVDFNALHISGTPTMILVDHNGVVKEFRNGKLSDRETDEFLRFLSLHK
jgi:predicted transcriptional regulator